MSRRPRRVVPAVLVASTLLGMCVAVGVSLVQRLIGVREYMSYDRVAYELHGRTWDEPQVLAVGSAVAVIGALLLVTALLPGRARVLPLTDSRPDGIEAGIGRRDLRALLRHSAMEVEGVVSARVRIRRDLALAIVRTDRRSHDDMAAAVCSVLGERVREVGAPLRRVHARVHGPHRERRSTHRRPATLRRRTRGHTGYAPTAGAGGVTGSTMPDGEPGRP
ncbi:DUF6286 domain-containing protein [Nocardia paucivorans]|uniref:DUF6286 domain-containing protein n=1 Tax=Nocardia paucivorans TaxID=114259 RepID=UPI00030DB882|nr:DUF6286 domain-containing protein [Nocardia paucivorans]